MSEEGEKKKKREGYEEWGEGGGGVDSRVCVPTLAPHLSHLGQGMVVDVDAVAVVRVGCGIIGRSMRTLSSKL